MLLFETYRRLDGASGGSSSSSDRRMQDKVRNKLTQRQYEKEVDVDVARAAGTAPFGGGAHT
jgi:hypothetical protein